MMVIEILKFKNVKMSVFLFYRCKFVEISARHALEIDDYYQLTLANILFNIPDW